MAVNFNTIKKPATTGGYKKAAPTTSSEPAETVLFLTAMEGKYGPYGIGSMTADELDKFVGVVSEIINGSGKAMFTLAQNTNKTTGKLFYTLKVKPATAE